jgi:hypothetical protein
MLCCVEKGSGMGFEFCERQFAHGRSASEEIQPIGDIQSAKDGT